MSPITITKEVFRWIEVLEEKNKPRLVTPLIYLRILIVAYSKSL